MYLTSPLKTIPLIPLDAVSPVSIGRKRLGPAIFPVEKVLGLLISGSCEHEAVKIKDAPRRTIAKLLARVLMNVCGLIK